MGLRFYHRFRIAPGFTLNLSKRGASVSAGVRGAHVTVGTSGTRETVGAPGTGVFFTSIQGRRRGRVAPSLLSPAVPAPSWGATAIVVLVLAVVIGLVIGSAS